MKRFRAVAAVVLAAALTSLAAAGDIRSQGPAPKHPLRFEDFFGFGRVSDPRISPDGTRITFTVTRYDIESNASNSDLWIVPADGSAPARRLTWSPASDSGGRWSPDGSTLAFVSSREGTPQIYLLPLSGGDPRRLTDAPRGASGPVWSPDGRRLLYAADVDAPGAAEGEGRPGGTADPQVEARVIDHLFYRHWNEWRTGRVRHLFVIGVEGGAPRDLTPGPHDVPPLDLGGGRAADYAFSPEGREVCYVSNHDPMVAASTNNDLFVVPLAGGEPKRITEGLGNQNSPVYSPDGRWIAYRSMTRAGFESDRSHLMLLDRRNGERRDLTADAVLSVGEIAWSPDSSTIYVTMPWHARTVIQALPLDEGEKRTLVDQHTNRAVRVAPDGGSLVFLREKINAPAEVFRMDLPEGAPRAITGVNRAALEEIDMGPASDFWFEGAGGELVHGLLVTPPGFSPERKYPLVYLIHGGPQGAWADGFHYRWNAHMFASPGYVVAMVNFHGSRGYGQEFCDAVSGDWGGKPYEDLMRGLDYLGKTYPFLDMDRVAGAGASYGGYMINWILGHDGARRFRCLVSHDGVYNLESMYGGTEELWFPEWEFGGTPWENPETYERWSPHRFAANFRTPTLVIHGERDYRVPYTEGLQLFTALQRQGVPSRLLFFPDEDHFVRKPRNARLWWATVLDWIATYLRKG